MKTLILAAVLTLVALAAVAPTASANPVCDGPIAPGPVIDDTWYYACGRVDCLEAGLPNILVTCL